MCCMTKVRSFLVVAEEFKAELGAHQRSAVGPFLFALVIDRLADEHRQDLPPWTAVFADDVPMCG